jgi:glycosyltransferase involved in cell wall biosynthesis
MPKYPLISVVTPFYNTADYLAEAIESTLQQTLGDFELVLLDNCSTDGSTDIGRQYAARDSRIRYVRNEQFLSQAGNYSRAATLISAGSRYFKMVQADDKIYPRCLLELVSLAESNPSVGVVSSYRHVGTEVMPARLPHLRPFMTGHDAARTELTQKISLFGTPTTVLYRAEAVRRNQPFYPEGALFPDTAAVYKVLREHDFGFVHEVLSFTRLDDASTYGRWQSFHPIALALVIRIAQNGLDHFTPAEFELVRQQLFREYYELLGHEWLSRRELDFWQFHRKGLAEIGQELDYAAIYRSAALEVLRRLGSPVPSVAALARKLFGGKTRSDAR